MLAKAAASEADLVFCDLEDSVSPAHKTSARRVVIEALRGLDWGNKTRAVRINGVHTPYAHEDVIELVTGTAGALDLLIVPKVKAARDVWWVETLLDQLEAKLDRPAPIGLEVLIEEVEGLANVDEIARSSPRIEAIIFGPGDLSASQGVRWGLLAAADYPGDIWHYARSRIVVAARSAGVDAIDGPFANFRDRDGYRTEAIRAALIGFAGKWALHPDQVSVANEVFSPTEDEVEAARRMVEAYEKAEEGAVGVEGVLVDAATVRIMQGVLDRAERIARRRQ
jgi:citrate lyase subunit beta/citryl-CoA lyase